MKFNFFKKRKKSQTQKEERFPVPLENLDNKTTPQVYRNIQPFESDASSFYEEPFAKNTNETKKKHRISPPKTPAIFLLGILLGAVTVLSASGIVAFLSLFSKFGNVYTKIIIPDFTRLSVSDAINQIENLKNFDYTVEYQENPSVAIGNVISQYPKPDTQRKLYDSDEKITIKLTFLVCE